MKHTIMKGVGAVVASGAAAVALAVPAHADNSLVNINRVAHLSSTHKIMYVGLHVTCSEDTTSASLSATVTQVTHGSVQTATGSVTSIGAFECSGEEETVMVPVRRPTGGYKWVRGTARVSNAVFVTADPSGVFIDTAKGRTVTVR